MTLPAFLDQLLARPPRTGDPDGGVHKWMFRVSRQLHAHLPATQIMDLLAERLANCGRHVPRLEIEAAVVHSLPCAWKPRGGTTAPPRIRAWPAVDQAHREAFVCAGGGLADLWEASPIRFEDDASHAEEIMDALFPGNPLLCCGWSKYRFDTRPREDWRGQLSKLQLIVPSAMTALRGLTQDSTPQKPIESAHTLNNTGPRQHLVVEFDKLPGQDAPPPIDEQAALLLHLAGFAPMRCALFSGGKSLHGWFHCAGQPEERLRRFFRYAVSLGADSVTWCRSQFVRMPDGQRDNGPRQTCYFFTPPGR